MNNHKHENRVAVMPRPNPLGERSRVFLRSERGKTMGIFADYSGQKHWRVTFLRKTEKRGSGGSVIWACRCECGIEFETRAHTIVSGHTKSCGCLSFENKSKTCIERNTTHGMSWKTKIYGVWCGMRRRCTDPKFKSFKDYGGRGIQVCSEWLDYKTFHDWAVTHGYQEGLELDRRDNNGSYSPDNCRFVTRLENARNKRPKYSTQRSL